MDEYCGSPFWDRNTTWDTTDPYFTPCFEETVLIWAPAAFLISFGLFDVNFSFKSRRRLDSIPWNLFTILKCILNAALIIIAIVQLVKVRSYDESQDVDTVSGAIRLLSYILSLALLILSKLKGVRSSGTIFLFWFSSSLCEAVLFRTAVRRYDPDDDTKFNFIYLMRLVIFPIVTLQLFLNCWADGTWTFGMKKGAGNKKTSFFGRPCPEKNSSFLSKILYSWFDTMAWNGYRKPLQFENLWDLNDEDATKEQVPLFYKHWNIAAQNARLESKKTGVKKEVGVISVIAKCYWPILLSSGGCRLIQDLLPFVSPEILKLLVAHVSPNNVEESWKGYMYGAALLAASLLQTIFSVQHLKRALLVGMRTRTALSSAVYRKALKVSNAAKKDTSVGEIVNLMSVDAQRLMDLFPMLHTIWVAPIQIGLSIYFLYNTLGPSVFAGLGVMILLVPTNGYLSTKIRALQMKQMVLKDERVKLMSELLSGMKVLKLYGWEPSFQDQIAKIREKEVALLRKISLLNASSLFSFLCAPFLVSLATFSVYVLTDETHNLNAEKAFVSLTLFNIVRMPLVIFPMVLALMVQAAVSVNRLNKYLNSEEIDPNAVTHEEHENPIVMKNGTFSWTPENKTDTLKDLQFQIRKGTLTAVVGSVGSGKSSLISAILGDIAKISGTVNILGSVAYVAQGAWIQNATLKDNILFNDPYDEAKYNRVIEACALGPDLQTLDSGDQTEIGEKGINLSGGQKQRVSLARAAYKEADIYLWDDPLSAVDAHVGKHIFDKLVGPNGMLKGKTRILVTHGVSFLPSCDNIMVLKDGSITEMGTFKELIRKKGNFAEFLTTHLGTDEDEELDQAFIDEIEETVGEETLRRHSSIIQRKRSTQLSLTKQKTGVPASALPEVKKLIEDEKAETGSIEMSVITDYFGPVYGKLASAVVIFIVSIAAGTYSNIWLSEWSGQATADEAATGGVQVKSTTDKYLSVYGALGLFQSVTVLIGGVLLALASTYAAATLHSRMLVRVMRAPMSFFDTTPLGRLINRFAKDVDMADNIVPLNLRSTLNIFLNIISIIVNIAYSTPVFLGFVAPVTVFYVFLQRFFVATSRQLKRIESVSRSPVYSKFGEAVSGALTIRAFGLEEDFVLEAEKKIDQNQKAYFPFLAASLWITTRLEMIGGLIIFAASIFAVTSRETIDPAIVGLSVSSALQITSMLNFFVRLMSDLETNIVSVERMKEITDTPQEAAWETEKRPPKDWPQNGAVEFTSYKTRYREGLDLVLKGITCSFTPGEKIGIVGRTGAGKSSLTLALFRLIEPVDGTISIDGQDIKEIGLHDLRRKLTIIPQDPVLFSGTLRINLDPFDAYSDKDIWRCLESAHLKPFVSSLAEGLEYEVQEEGQNFSVGQRQLICLARALLRKTRILILDEATAAVDLETDDLIQKTIRQEFADSTVITIAHRLLTIMDSNRIVVLDKGQIVEFDTPQELLKNQSSIFFGMAKDAGIV